MFLDPVPLTDPVIEAIAKKYNKSPGHVILRWVVSYLAKMKA